MKFGAFLVQHRGPSLAAAARAAEDLGYESAWMAAFLRRSVGWKDLVVLAPDNQRRRLAFAEVRLDSWVEWQLVR